MSQYLRYFSVLCIANLGYFISLTVYSDSVNIQKDAAQHQAYLGLWQTVDDETNQPRSLVLLSIDNGQLSAKITQVYPAEGESDDPVCEKCKGKLKNVQIIGLNILKGMTYEDNAWQDGEILDPNNGKFYDAKIWLENDQLQVRGYIGFFFRTQQWRRLQPTTQ